MKYCLRYSNISTKLNKCDEITIKYIEDKGLIDFLKRHDQQRINLLIDVSYFPDSEVRKLVAIKQTYPQYNFTAALSAYKQSLIDKLREATISFYVAEPCLDWEMLNILVAAQVCDINISGPLAFELEKVKKAVKNIRLRATPNKVENLYPENTNSLIGFYIRPEDVELYERYIDVLDFEGVERQDAFYTIYAEQKSFIGNLNQCIYNLNLAIDNKAMVKLFGERRMNCGRQCLSGGGCRRCYSLAHLAELKSEDIRATALETIEQEKAKLSES